MGGDFSFFCSAILIWIPPLWFVFSWQFEPLTSLNLSSLSTSCFFQQYHDPLTAHSFVHYISACCGGSHQYNWRGRSTQNFAVYQPGWFCAYGHSGVILKKTFSSLLLSQPGFKFMYLFSGGQNRKLGGGCEIFEFEKTINSSLVSAIWKDHFHFLKIW